MEKIEFKKVFKHLLVPSAKEPQIIDVPEMQFLMVDGTGAPEAKGYETAFQQAIQALYGTAYTIKFSRKKAGLSPDYTVGALEALWWMDGEKGFDMSMPDKWHWTVMIWQPDFITQKDFNGAVMQLKAKRRDLALDKVRLEKLIEGTVVQIMHIGPYADEPKTIAVMHSYAKEQGFKLTGKHHEIYFGDPRRTAPNKLKTILRQPVTK